MYSSERFAKLQRRARTVAACQSVAELLEVPAEPSLASGRGRRRSVGPQPLAAAVEVRAVGREVLLRARGFRAAIPEPKAD